MKNTISVYDWYDSFLGFLERRLPILTISFFILGVIMALWVQPFAQAIDTGVNGFIDGYGIVAPIVIYLILTPALVSVLMSAKGGKKFIVKMILWFASTRVAALIWAVLFTVLVFGLPLYSSGGATFLEAFTKSMAKLGWMLTHSIYFYAIYASLFSVFVAIKIRPIAKFFFACATMVERLGKHIIPLIPLFMLAIGAYVTYLPTSIGQQVNEAYAEQFQGTGNTPVDITASGFKLHTIHMLGITLNPATPLGMIFCYVAGALLTGIACFIWHGALLLVAKIRVRRFSIAQYFKNYWVKVYPLLWSTSSEALTTPLNLYLVRKNYPNISDEIRRFSVGGGSFLGINGTVICVYVLGGLVTSILGIQVTLMQLILSIPLIFLLGYGIPGIPGELVIFAGPISIILGLPPAIIPIFLAIYVGFQIGLPDSFRTGANSTDNCVNGVILQNSYERTLRKRPEEIDADVIKSLLLFGNPYNGLPDDYFVCVNSRARQLIEEYHSANEGQKA